MAPNALEIQKQIATFLRGLTLRQRATLVLGTVLVAATLWVFVRLLSKADFKPLYSGLAPAEAQALSQQLAAKNIPYELSSDGTTLSVPTDKLDAVRLDMAAKGLPQSGRLGFELFDKPNWAGSDFAEKVNYQRALEGELERTIQTLREVEAVRVHLVLPRESIFTEREQEAKASVLVKLRGARLGDESLVAITHLVASAVDNLRPENVTVIDAQGHQPLLSRGKLGGARPREIVEMETALMERLVATLTPVVGEGKVRANVTVEPEISSIENTQETYDPNASVVLSSQISEERLGQMAPEGIPGTTSNVPNAQTSGNAAVAVTRTAETQGQRSESKTYGVSRTVRHTVQPPGGIKRLTAAVLIDDAVEVKEENGQRLETRRKRTPDERQQIQELATASIGLDPARGDRLAVVNLSFQTLPFEEPPAPAWADQVLPIVQKWMGLLRYAVFLLLFLLVYWLVLRPVKRQIVTSFKELPAQLKRGTESAVALAGGAAELAAAVEGGAALANLAGTSDEVKRAIMLKRTLVDKVVKEPASASRLVQNWLQENEE